MAIKTGPSVRLQRTITFDMGNCVAATTTQSSAQTCVGATTDMVFLAKRPSAMNAGLIIVEVICDAVDTVKFRFGNLTAVDVDPASLAYEIVGV